MNLELYDKKNEVEQAKFSATDPHRQPLGTRNMKNRQFFSQQGTFAKNQMLKADDKNKTFLPRLAKQKVLDKFIDLSTRQPAKSLFFQPKGARSLYN